MVIKYADFPMKYVEEKKFKTMYIDDEDYKGYLSQIHIIKTNQPDRSGDENYHGTTENGCKWLEFYPENSNVAMTVGYDIENNILDWYFDIIDRVGIQNGNPYFEDLYLDILMTPDNKIKLLDEDEIKEALEQKQITEEQFELAYNHANNLIKRIDGKVEELKEFCNKYFEIINLIAEIKDEDIGEKSVPVEKYRVRYGARGIVFKEDGKIAVFNKKAKNEFKLPGGGIDDGETSAEAFKRECFEETGCVVKIVDFIGTIKESKTQDSFKQISYIYVAKVIEETKELHVTEQEKAEGARLFWEEPKNALKLITDCFDKIIASPCEETEKSMYYTKFIVKRDKKILEKYLENK